MCMCVEVMMSLNVKRESGEVSSAVASKRVNEINSRVCPTKTWYLALGLPSSHRDHHQLYDNALR